MKIKLKHLHYLVAFISFLFYSCSALKPQQKTTLEQFAASAKTYTELPKEVLTTYGECLYKSDKLRAVVKEKPDDVIKELDKAVDNNFTRTDFTSEFNTTYKLLGKYFQALLNFAAVDTSDEVKTNIASLGVNIDSLISSSKSANINTIPLGFGTIAGDLFKYFGKRRIRQQQLKYFKEFLQRGDALVNHASSVLNTIIINSLIRGDLETGNNQTSVDFLRYLDKIDSTDKKVTDFYNDLSPVYLDVKTCYGKAILLMKQLATITTRLSEAHHEMLQVLNTKGKKVTAPKIAAFIESVEQMDDLVKQFKESDK